MAAFCCFEKVHAGNRSLTYGSPPRTVPARAYAGHFEDEGEYGDLIEPDAKIRQVSLAGRVWNGERFIQLDLDLRASASNAHYKESMYQFVITDQSSEPLAVEWDLMTRIKPERSFFKESPKGQAFRQSTYVFYTDGRPAPAQGVIQVRTADGKSLGHFAADGFLDRGNTKRNSMSPKSR